MFLILSCSMAVAQNAVMKVRTRTNVSAGQTFQITYEVNARAENFQMPSLKGLTHVGGPSTGFSSSTSIINGKVSRSESQTFTILVQADKEGTANVGVARCTVDGKSVSSEPFTVSVSKADPNRQQQQQNQSGWGWGQPSQPRQQQQQQPTKTIDNNTLFARASINKSNLYQGEEAIIVYKIYTQVPLTQFQIDKLPRNKGFWSEDLSENMTQVRQYSETYNGRQYQVAEIRRGALYPQETGKLEIAPLKTDVVAIIQTQMQRQRTGTILDFFIDDPFFAPTQNQAVVKSLTSNSINVNVKPLPEAPEGFCGGVGNFSVSAKSDLSELHANDAFTYSVTISGRGNLSLIEAPKIVFPKGMEVYEPRVVDNISKSDNGLSGSRTFEWIITPQTQGEYDIADGELVFFDPVAGHYVTKSINAIHIKVDKPLHGAGGKSDVKELNSDIHHIRTSTKLHNSDRTKPTWVFWMLIALSATAGAVVVALARRQQSIESDEASMRLQRATKLARKRLRNAEKHLGDNNDEAFYEEIYKALWGGISDKFNIPLAQLNADTVQMHLKEKEVDKELADSILQTLDEVSFARFAPGDSSQTKQTIYQKAMETITKIAALKNRSGKTKKSTVALILVLVAALPAMAGENENYAAFNQANAAYDSGDYARASELYNSIIEKGYESWELYYNLGNAHYRSEEIGLAVLNYERALRLSPNNKEIKDNLRLAQSKASDNIEKAPRLFLWQWADSIASIATPRGWRAIVVVAFLLFCISVSAFFIVNDYKKRRALFVSSAILLFLLIIVVLFATISTRKATNDNRAVITAPMIVVKSAPDAKSVEKFLLHEGAELTITDRQDQWWQIEIDDGKSGWIAGGAEVI